MKKFGRIVCLVTGIFVFCCGETVYAGVADSSIQDMIKLPDGTIFNVSQKGDETFNYSVVENTNEIVILKEDDSWYHGELSEDNTHIVATTAKYQIDSPKEPVLVESELLKKINLEKSTPRLFSEKSAPEKVARDQNIVVIMVEFFNVKFNDRTNEPRTLSDWSTTFFGNNDGEVSVANYYKETTGDKINILPAATTQFSDAPGIIKLTLDEPHPNTGTDVNGLLGGYMENLLHQAEPYIDFEKYDKNNDQVISPNELHVVFVLAGGEASSYSSINSVWAHKSSEPLKTRTGLSFNFGYMVTGEISKTMNIKNDGTNISQWPKTVPITIGPIAHEFGHELGLPDLYNQEELISSGGVGLGIHSLMSSSWGEYRVGNDTTNPAYYSGASPVHLDAYSKSLLGVPVELVDSSKEVDAQTIFSEEGKIYKIPVDQENSQEYYLIENKQLRGFDRGRAITKSQLNRASSGIAVYHINEIFSSNYNTNKYGEQLVTLMEADEQKNGQPLLLKKARTGNNSYFNQQSNPLFDSKSNPYLMSEENTPKFSMKVEDKSEDSMHISFEKNIQGMFGSSKWIWDEETQTVTFGGGGFPASNKNSNIETVIEGDPMLKGKKIRKIIFTEPIIMNENSSHLFSNLYELEMTEQTSLLEMSKVKNASYLFATDNFESALKQLDVGSWDTSNMTDMESMFGGQSCLEQLDVSKWETSNVTNMSYLFYLTKGLKGLDVSKWDTSNVTDMSYLFYISEGLKSLNVSKWDTSNVIDMTGLFAYSGMESLAVDKWETSNVVNMTALFGGTKLSTVDVSKWDTSNVTDMSSLFSSSSISTLDISKWDTSKVETFDSMFAYMNNLISLDLSNFDLSSVKKDGLAFMFRSNKGLKNLDVSNWDVSRSNKFLRLFTDCSSLESIDLSSWDMRGEVYPFDGWAMFMNMASLNTIILGENNRFSPDTFLPEKSEEPYTGTWVLQSGDNKYSSSKEFMSNYDGSKPGTYVREKLVGVTGI